MADQPNILLIITDHQAWYQHYFRDDFNIDLPQWEAFASQGTMFERTYAVAPICTPARASMMTGCYPSQHGMIWNTNLRHRGNHFDFRPDQKLYSHHLSEAGYRNAYIGKWHCGTEKIIADYGIEGWCPPEYGQPYLTDKYRSYAKSLGLGRPTGTIEHRLRRSGETGHGLIEDYMDASGTMDGPIEGHHDHFVSNLAKEKLAELCQSQQPWSLVASYWGPHHAYFPTEPFANTIDPTTIPEDPTFNEDLSKRPFRYTQHFHTHSARTLWPKWSTWQKILARTYEQQMQTDHAIGQLLEALRHHGQAENTIVIWVADHGDTIGTHGGMWDKSSTYTEEVARVPLTIRWPVHFRGNNRSSALVSNMDVTATMLEAAGIAIPTEMASRSLLPLCRDPHDAEWSNTLICEHNGHGINLLQRILFQDQYKYVAAIYDGDELYDLQKDPNETNNLIQSPDHQSIAENLRHRLLHHIESTDDRVASPLRPWLEGAFGAK
ncbi:MAG: sulfatase-like hydrolase/transferase [Candidatus Latescibacteria bacterium]|nr:sulfatase-like hydrolase/transferase [Candidatus Latescibacterota bacterium]